MKEGYRPAVRRREKGKGRAEETRNTDDQRGGVGLILGRSSSPWPSWQLALVGNSPWTGLRRRAGSSCVRWAVGVLRVSRAPGLMLVRVRWRSKSGRSDLSRQQASGRALTRDSQDEVDRDASDRGLCGHGCCQGRRGSESDEALPRSVRLGEGEVRGREVLA